MKRILFPVAFLFSLGVYAQTFAPSSAQIGLVKKGGKAFDSQNWFSAVKNYEKAIDLLKEADQNKSADWHNLMGYSLRKKAVPNLNEAEKYYISALNLDPKHRGALEYYGELLLLKNDLAGAEKLLARLDKACTFGCEEFQDLKKSIQQYKDKKP
jgi:tetratricopeptide (TPR) repeat protein